MIRKAFYWSAFAQLISFAITFGGSVIVARLLSPREMGIYAVSLAAIGVLQIFAAFGVGNYVIREVKLDEHTVDTAFTLNMVISIILSIGTFAISSAGARFLSDPAIAPVLRLLAITPLFSILDFRSSTMMQRAIRIKPIAIVNIAAILANTMTTVAAAYSGASYMSQAYGGVLGAAVNSAGLLILGRQHIRFRTSLTGARPMLIFGLRMMSVGGVSALAARLNDIILGRMLGLTSLGLFGRASSLNMLIFNNVYGTITRVVFVKLSHDYREQGRLRESFLKWLNVIGGVMGPFLLGFAVLAKPAILLLYGERWLDAALPLSLLLVAQFITLRYAMNWEAFVIRDQLGKQSAFEISRSVFTLVSRTIGCLFGLIGAAGAAIVDAFFSVAIYGKQIDRLIEAERGDLTNVTVKTIVLSLIAILPAVLVMATHDWSAQTPLPLVFGSVAIGMGLWLVALAWLDHPLFTEISAIANLVHERLGSPLRTPAFRGKP